MVLVRKFGRTPFVTKLASWLILCLFLIGGLVIAVCALAAANTSNERSAAAGQQAKVAAAQAREVAACVNGVLKARGPISKKVTDAAKEAADADAAYVEIQREIFPASHAEQLRLAHQFFKALDVDAKAHKKLQAAYAEQARVQIAHPLGLC